MLVVPAIDIIDGKCVRLSQGDYATQKTYNTNPLAVAQTFAEAGITHLHLVDLDGAKAGHIVNHKVLEAITTQTPLVVDFGGGIKTNDAIQQAFDYGAAQVTVGSIAVKSPDTVARWIAHYGADKLILGADVKDNYIAINGWTEQTQINLFDFIESYAQQGLRYVLCTDIAKDGMLQGPAISLYSQLLQAYPNLQLIASGGVSSVTDLEELRTNGLYAAVVGKAFYEGAITLNQLKTFANVS